MTTVGINRIKIAFFAVLSCLLVLAFMPKTYASDVQQDTTNGSWYIISSVNSDGDEYYDFNEYLSENYVSKDFTKIRNELFEEHKLVRSTTVVKKFKGKNAYLFLHKIESKSKQIMDKNFKPLQEVFLYTDMSDFAELYSKNLNAELGYEVEATDTLKMPQYTIYIVHLTK